MRSRIVAAAATLLLATAQDSTAQVQKFVQQWAGPDAIANGFLTLDLAVLLNPGDNSTTGTPFVTDFELRLTGAYSGNGTFTLADYDGIDSPFGAQIAFSTGATALDFTRELVGQPSMDGAWGMLEDGRGFLSLLREYGSAAPQTAGSFAIATSTGTDMLALASIRPALCGDAPVGALDCRAAVGSRMVLKDTESADSLKWQWIGDGFGQADLGDPTTGDTYYSLCIYDETASVPVLAGELGINRGEGWTDNGTRGVEYAYDGSSFGVTRAKVKLAADGRTSVKLQAGTEAFQLPAPFGTEFFDQDASVTVQLVSSEGTCWSSSYGAADTSRNEATVFKARIK
jgi:hypothetical protein